MGYLRLGGRLFRLGLGTSLGLGGLLGRLLLYDLVVRSPTDETGQCQMGKGGWYGGHKEESMP